MMRLFVAIELPEWIKTHLKEVGQQLNGRLPSGAVRWVRPDRMHLTLRFLGDTAVSRLDEVVAALDTAVAGVAPFVIKLDNLGCFPHCQQPRVIWVGLTGELTPLFAIKQTLDNELAALGWAQEGRFRPHLTLGRVKQSEAVRGAKWKATLKPQTIPVTAVQLLSSELTSSGPNYTVQHSSYLGNG